MRKLLLVLVAVLLVALPALASAKSPDKVAPARPSGIEAQRLFEGFEGTFPPAGWTLSSASGHVAPENFYQGDATVGTPYEGDYFLVCEWDPDYIAQDNKLEFDHAIIAGEDHLNFYISGSLSWIANYDCTVEIDGVEVYSWQDTYAASASWTYEFVNIDLTSYIGNTVNIAFHYTGYDGAAIYIDALSVDDNTWTPPPPPEAPLNDTCEGAYDNEFVIPPGAFSLVGDNTYANADYYMSYGSCTGYSFSGYDLVWVVCMEQGDVLDVTMTTATGFDASFYLVTDCTDPFGSCVVGADDPETFTYTAAATGIYYLICGGYSSGIGEFYLDGMLTGAGCGTVATEDTNWGSLKSLYR